MRYLSVFVALFFVYTSCHREKAAPPLQSSQYSVDMLDGTWVWCKIDGLQQPSQNWFVDVNENGHCIYSYGENGVWKERDEGTFRLETTQDKTKLIYSNNREYDVIYMDTTSLLVRYRPNNKVYSAHKAVSQLEDRLIGAWTCDSLPLFPGYTVNIVFAWERIHFIATNTQSKTIINGIPYKLYGDLLVVNGKRMDGTPFYQNLYLTFVDDVTMKFSYVDEDLKETNILWRKPEAQQYNNEQLLGDWVMLYENGHELLPYRMSVDSYYNDEPSHMHNTLFSSSIFTPDSTRIWKIITSEVTLKNDVLLYSASDNDTRWRSTYQILYMNDDYMITQRKYSSVNKVDRIRVARKVNRGQYAAKVEGKWTGVLQWTDGERNSLEMELYRDAAILMQFGDPQGMGTYRCKIMDSLDDNDSFHNILGRYYLVGPLLVLVLEDGKSHWAAWIDSCDGTHLELSGLVKLENDKVVKNGSATLTK